MKQKHRLMLIGCGGMASTHAERLGALSERLTVASVVDVVPERAAAVAALLPDHPRVLTDFRDGLADCDVVLQVLPHDLHASCVIECLEAGKHVLAEKPLANSEAECRAMIECAERNKRTLMVAYCMRFHPLVRRFKELLDSGVYGKCFQLSIWTEQHTERDPSDWMCRADTLGGGQLFSHGCHYIDLMLWMMGKPVEGTHFGTNLGTPWMEREGTSNVCIKFADGALGYHFGTWGARGTRLRYSFHAHCEQGMLEADIAGGKLYFHQDRAAHIPGQFETGDAELLMEHPHAKPTVAEMAHFLDCVETGARPLTNPLDSLEGLRVIWELYAAEDRHGVADLRHIADLRN